MNTIDIGSTRRVRNNTTLKSVLNRQFVALNGNMPVSAGLFDCNRTDGIGTTEPSISFKPFERVYSIGKDTKRYTITVE